MIKMLKPMEIAKRGLIRNSRNSKSVALNYQFILQEIGVGRLKARNYGHKSRPYYLVSEQEINRYIKNIIGE